MITTRAIFFASVLVVAASACSPELFDSVTPVTSSVLGMTWSDPVAIEPRPGVSEDDPRSVKGFDIASSGDALHVGGAFYETFSGDFEGRIVRWTPADGWSGGGDLTRSIASDSGFEHVAGARGPGNTAILAFSDPGTDALVTAYYQEGAWNTEKSQTVSDQPVFPSATSETSGLLPRFTIGFDGLGRALFGFVDANGDAQARLWESAASTGVLGATWDSVVGADGGTYPSRASFLSDGTSVNCLITEIGDDTDRALSASCHDLSGTDHVYDHQLVDSGIRGHAAASDGAGTIVIVADYAATSQAFNLIGIAIESGTPSEAASIVSAGMPIGMRTASGFEDGSYAYEALPEVVYLGDGEFLAAWIGVIPSEGIGLSSQVFASVYSTSSAAWSAPVEVTDLESFTSRPHHRAISLFTNGAGDAGIAINHIGTEGAAAGDDVHDVIVRRYNAREGWLTRTTVGLGCTGSLRECTRRPRGAILDSGESAVVFIDQDENGNYRLKATTFSAE